VWPFCQRKGFASGVIAATSVMAAPHVTGAVALHVACRGRASNADGVVAIRQALISLSEPQASWRADHFVTDPDSNHEALVNVRAFPSCVR